MGKKLYQINIIFISVRQGWQHWFGEKLCASFHLADRDIFLPNITVPIQYCEKVLSHLSLLYILPGNGKWVQPFIQRRANTNQNTVEKGKSKSFTTLTGMKFDIWSDQILSLRWIFSPISCRCHSSVIDVFQACHCLFFSPLVQFPQIFVRTHSTLCWDIQSFWLISLLETPWCKTLFHACQTVLSLPFLTDATKEIEQKKLCVFVTGC